MLEMATLNGANALRLEREIGSIEVGKKADLILVTLRKPHLVPAFNVVSHLVYAAEGSDVQTVIIDGKIVMENRIVETLDEERIMREADRRAAKLLERAGLNVITKWTVI